MKNVFLLTALAPGMALSAPATVVDFIKVDQFGYRPTAQKIAVISDPQTGYNAAQSFTPGTTYEIRDWNTDAMVYTGSTVVWNGGATHAQSGDKAWWFDFSSFTTVGSYYVYDVTNDVGSGRFEIGNCSYAEALQHAVRMYYYQRCGSAKTVAHAGTGWADASCHVGALQDTDCRLYNNNNVSTSKDLSGGWHDAGDYNKYVNFTFSAMLDLLLAYEESPTVFTDNFNLPESGNGIPDLLDEIKYELDWLLKMQNSDGSVLSIVGGGAAYPPSTDAGARVYGPATTAASFCAASIFALGAIQFESIGQTTYATILENAAIDAYTWADANPGVTFYNAGIVGAGEQQTGAYETDSRHMAAAVYLFALTGTGSYQTYIDANYTNIHLLQWGYAYPFEGPEQDAMLYYTALPNSTPGVATAIRNAFSSSMSTNNNDNLPNFLNQTDAYRAYMADNNYTWNSNQTKSKQGNMFLAMNVHGLNTANATNYTNAASGFLHYFHGVNPNQKTYLSNMNSFGAENSVTTFYHAWFHDGSALWDEVGVSTYGPPPGFIPGGPNPTYDWDPCCPGSCGSVPNNALCTAISITPPKNQPIQKSYLDFNNSWPLNSWTVTEAGIYTNAAYVRMVSKFTQGSCFTVSAEEITPPEPAVDVYPSPAEELLNIRFSGAKSNQLQIEVYDASGKLLLTTTNPIQQYTHLATINIVTLATGMYFIKVSDGTRTVGRKFLKK